MILKILKLNDRQDKVENGLNVIVKLHENLEGKVTAIGTSLDTQQKTFSDSLAAMEMKLTEKIEQMFRVELSYQENKTTVLKKMPDT